MNPVRPRIPADLPLSQRDCEADGATHFMAALRVLNEAAYAAAKAARKANSPLADELRQAALRTDEFVDGVAA